MTNQPRLIDIGVNLLHPQFDSDRPKVVQRALETEVQFVITSTNLEETTRAIAYCRENPTTSLGCTAGIHPHDVDAAEQHWRVELGNLVSHPQVLAIGETGLDFYRSFSAHDQQRRVFADQVALAVEVDKPIFVHDRESAGEVFNILDDAQVNPGRVVIHCFTGTASELSAYVDKGYYIGITGWVCDKKRGQALRDIVTQIPLHQLLIETDAPFLRPQNAPRATTDIGRRNEPHLLPNVLSKLAECFNTDAPTLAAQTYSNASRFFNLVDTIESKSTTDQIAN